MTFPSRKNRRTTRSATIRAAWTSLAALGLALPVLAQSQPAQTTWKPYQNPQVQSNPVAPPVTVTDVPVIPNPVMIPNLTTVAKPLVTQQAPLPVVRPVEVAPQLAPRMELPPLPEMPVAPPAQPVAKQIVKPVNRVVPLPNVTTVAAPVQQPVPVRPAVRQAPPPQTPPPMPITAPFPPPIVAPAPAQSPMPTPTPATPTAPPPMTQKPPLTAADVIPNLSSTLAGLRDQQDLFRLDSDEAINARILREIKKAEEKFPVLPPMVPANVPYVPKTAKYSPMQVMLEPHYVIHRRLFFEEMNSERAGWDAGPAQSVFSTAYFFRDVLLFPSRATSNMKTCFDASPGKCRPGDPTPYYYYPHGVTWFGAAVGGALYTGMGFIVW